MLAAHGCRPGPAQGRPCRRQLDRRPAAARRAATCATSRPSASMTQDTHGTGCTLASAIACWLGAGLPIERGLRPGDPLRPHRRSSKPPGLGEGNGPLGHQFVTDFQWRQTPDCGTWRSETRPLRDGRRRAFGDPRSSRTPIYFFASLRRRADPPDSPGWREARPTCASPQGRRAFAASRRDGLSTG